MKNIKTIVAVLLMVVLFVTLAAFLGFAIEDSTAKSSAQAETPETEGMFGIVEGEGFDPYRIIVDRSNGVMYWMSAGSYNNGNITLLVDADGMPRIWEGWEE